VLAPLRLAAMGLGPLSLAALGLVALGLAPPRLAPDRPAHGARRWRRSDGRLRCRAGRPERGQACGRSTGRSCLQWARHGTGRLRAQPMDRRRDIARGWRGRAARGWRGRAARGWRGRAARGWRGRAARGWRGRAAQGRWVRRADACTGCLGRWRRARVCPSTAGRVGRNCNGTGRRTRVRRSMSG